MAWTALAAAGMAVALCAVGVRQHSPELAALLTLSACVLILGRTLPMLEEVLKRMRDLSDRAGVSPAVLLPVVKTVGLAVLTRLAASLCRDAGEGSIAVALEMAGSAAAVVVALPLLDVVLGLVMDLL